MGKCFKMTLLTSKNMTNLSIVNPVTDTEHFTKTIVSFISSLLPPPQFLCEAVQVTQGKGRREAIWFWDRWSFEGWLTDGSSYCYRLLCCLPSSSDKREKGARRGWRDEGWVIVTSAFNRKVILCGGEGQSRQWHELLSPGASWRWTTLKAAESDRSDSSAPTRVHASQIPLRQVCSKSLTHQLFLLF